MEHARMAFKKKKVQLIKFLSTIYWMTFLAAVLRDSEAASRLPQRRRLLRSHEKLSNRIKGPSEKWGQIFCFLFFFFPSANGCQIM